MKMRKWSAVLALVLVAAMLLAGCGAKTEEPSAEESADTLLEIDGLKLTVPAEYADLLIAETYENNEDDVLFGVSEKASVEAAKKQGDEFVSGAGWLFSIGRISYEKLCEQMMYDMSGQEVIGRDGDTVYMFYHPTDVPLVREEGGYTEEAMQQWSELCEWAWSVPATFCEENGIEPFSAANDTPTIIFARAAYWEGAPITLSQGETSADLRAVDGVQETLERLVWNAACEYENASAPDGEPILLDVACEETYHEQLCFWAGSDIVGTTGEYPTYYRVTFTDGSDQSVGDCIAELFALASLAE